MSEDKERRCGVCGLPIQKNELGIRSFGFFIAHSDNRCIELLKAEIAARDAELARLREALHEIIEQGRTGEDAYVMADLALEALKSHDS